MILITGATGQLGSAVIKHLLKKVPADQIAGLARSEEKATELRKLGIEARIGSYDDTASLNEAFKGVSKVLLISGLDANRLEQHKNVIDAAKKADVDFFAYTGVAMKDESHATNAFMLSHFETEAYLKESGLTYGVLRNSLYTDGLPLFTGEHAVETGIFLPAGDGKVPYALRDEMAEAAANLLASDVTESRIYEITGSEAYSFGDVAQILSELSGKEVGYVKAEADAFEAKMKELGVPDFAIGLVSAFAADIKAGRHEKVSGDLEELLGRKPASFKESLKSFYNL